MTEQIEFFPEEIPDFARLFSLEGTHPDDVTLTPLSAFLMWVALQICADEAYDDIELDAPDRVVFNLYPRITRGQDVLWLRDAARSFDDLWMDLEVGVWPVPTCVAEEMALHTAIERMVEMIDADEIAFPAGIPVHSLDGDADLLSECLFQDFDILMLLDPAFDGMEAPDAEMNKALGVGNYKPEAWFVPFKNAIVKRDPNRGYRR